MKTFYITGHFEPFEPQPFAFTLEARDLREALNMLNAYEVGRKDSVVVDTLSTRKTRGVEYSPLIP